VADGTLAPAGSRRGGLASRPGPEASTRTSPGQVKSARPQAWTGLTPGPEPRVVTARYGKGGVAARATVAKASCAGGQPDEGVSASTQRGPPLEGSVMTGWPRVPSLCPLLQKSGFQGLFSPAPRKSAQVRWREGGGSGHADAASLRFPRKLKCARYHAGSWTRQRGGRRSARRARSWRRPSRPGRPGSRTMQRFRRTPPPDCWPRSSAGRQHDEIAPVFDLKFTETGGDDAPARDAGGRRPRETGRGDVHDPGRGRQGALVRQAAPAADPGRGRGVRLGTVGIQHQRQRPDRHQPHVTDPGVLAGHRQELGPAAAQSQPVGLGNTIRGAMWAVRRRCSTRG
jgi:hypothetical protein